MAIAGYLTTREAAELVGITPGAIRRAVALGQLVAIHMTNRRVVFDPDVLIAFRDRKKGRGGRPSWKSTQTRGTQPSSGNHEDIAPDDPAFNDPKPVTTTATSAVALDAYLTTKEAAIALGLTADYVRKLVGVGRLHSARIEGTLFFRPEDLEEYRARPKLLSGRYAWKTRDPRSQLARWQAHIQSLADRENTNSAMTKCDGDIEDN